VEKSILNIIIISYFFSSVYSFFNFV